MFVALNLREGHIFDYVGLGMIYISKDYAFMRMNIES